MDGLKTMDAVGIAKMIKDEGGRKEMLFEIVRDKKSPDTTMSKDAIEGLAAGFEGFLGGNIAAFWERTGKPAQRVRVQVKIVLDAEGLPQALDGSRRGTNLDLDVPVEETDAAYYTIRGE
jgi:hypothetical protein